MKPYVSTTPQDVNSGDETIVSNLMTGGEVFFSSPEFRIKMQRNITNRNLQGLDIVAGHSKVMPRANFHDVITRCITIYHEL